MLNRQTAARNIRFGLLFVENVQNQSIRIEQTARMAREK